MRRFSVLPRGILSFRTDTSYAILVVCDADCEDVDAYLYLGSLIDEDIEPDNYPLIRHVAQFSTRYRIEVRMEECGAPRCTYNVGVFRAIG